MKARVFVGLRRERDPSSTAEPPPPLFKILGFLLIQCS
jgi:hypothetical protein